MKSGDIAMNTLESTSCKVLIDPSIPIEDLLGSVTMYNNVEGSDTKSFQLRTSARVFKKMKLDSAVAALPIIVEKKEPEKKEELKPSSELKKDKGYRPLWSQEDKNLFFEALNEYGKDFDAIHTYITVKFKKKGLPEISIKTREQIRHLYYRTWHKISKHLKFSEDVKKIAQELYGLINYGELRKKLMLVSEKTCIKLNELIYRGSVNIRVKGKTIRIKTPMCKALRRLNQLDEKTDDIKLPPRVTVELIPKNMETWVHVQELSQNPRVKTTLPLQKRLSSLITFMTEKWKTQEVFEHQKIIAAANTLADSTDENLLEDIKPRADPLLKLCPPSDINVTIPTINLTEYFTAQSICLNAYEDRIGAKTSGEQLWLQAYPNCRNISKAFTKRGVKRSRTESVSEKTQTTPKPSVSSATTKDNNENCVSELEISSTKVDLEIDEAVNTILSLQTQEMEEKLPERPLENFMKVEEDCLKEVKKEHDIAKLRQGWSLHDCGTLAIGDLYLMFGSDSKIVLEYSWNKPEQVQFKQEIELMDENSENIIDTDNSDNCNNHDINTENELTIILKRLLSIAKLHYRKNMVKCPCGHVCGSPTKPLPARSKCGTKNYRNGLNDGKMIEVQDSTTNIMTIQQSPMSSTSMVPVLIQPQIRTFAPSSLFRRPNSPNVGLRAQLDSIQRLKPRYCNRRGRRPRSKQVVVERKLPLLANKADSGRIVQMNLISQDNISSPRQIAPKIVPQISTSIQNVDSSTSMYVEATLTSVAVTSDEATGTFTIIPMNENNIMNPNMTDNATTASRVGSPTSISNLLEMALNSHDNTDPSTTSFVGLLAENNISQSHSTPPTSPSRILKENENQWLNSEVADFSLSSFLGHLESPAKNVNSPPCQLSGEDTRLCLSQDVDAQLHSLLTESSLDYTAKFADLAAQVTNNKK